MGKNYAKKGKQIVSLLTPSILTLDYLVEAVSTVAVESVATTVEST